MLEEKIYKFGSAVLDELLLHRNVDKNVKISIEDAAILRDMIIHVGPQTILTFDENEIAEFYRIWALNQQGNQTRRQKP